MEQMTIDAMVSDLIRYGSSMKVIKRNGEEVSYDASKIIDAIKKANNEFDDEDKRLTETQIFLIAENITKKFKDEGRSPGIEEIQNEVIREIMKQGAYDVADAYSVYRYKRALSRQRNTTDDIILSLVDFKNEDVKQENSNKNPRVASTQRDYMAGKVSEDLTMRVLLPEDIVEAHEAGILHFHDADYFAQRIYNCCLINLRDALRHNTVITKTLIETPKSFTTACNIATQIIAQTASNQYGGQTFSLAHLVPFVEISRRKWRDKIASDQSVLGVSYTEEQINKIAERRLHEEICSGIQMIQYQLLTLMTTNGQTPFVSMFIHFGELPEGQTRDDMKLLVKEVLEQRIYGIKNEKGVLITPAFPKLLYVLDEDNAYPGSKYYDMTRLACKCTAKRMVPDYISAKKMRELKNGDVYPCMGCVDGKSVIDYKINGKRYVEDFERAWGRLSMLYDVKKQSNGTDHYIDTPDVEIWDCKENRYVKQYRIIRNTQSAWYKISFTSGRYLDVTNNHPFEIMDKGVVLADDLQIGDKLYCKDAEICEVEMIGDYHESKYSYDVTTESEHFMVNEVYSHNCRSFLTPDRFTDAGIGNISKALDYDEDMPEHRYYGRFNQGVVTLNLVDVACSSGKDFDKFWKILDERLNLCYKALRCRHERLLGTPSDIAPILFQYGVIARLEKGEVIDPLLFNGYSTISLGYAGLYEMCVYMCGKSHTDPEGKPFAIEVMKKLNEACAKWREKDNIDFSVYGTPLESTTYKFAKALRKRWGKIKDVTDHDYITNSYHVNVREKIDAFEKLKFESEFQALSPGGAISYIEVPDMQDNIEAVEEVVQYIYKNIMYAELNTKSDYCMECGYDGEISIEEDESGKVIWVCPNCGNKDETKMSVARRTCGYIGTEFWNQGRTKEIRDRTLHL